MRATILAVLAGVAFAAAGSARADDLTAANAAFDQKDYAKAFELYSPLARAGDAAAQSAIGSLYFFGNGVQKNPARAYMWFDLAAQSPAPVATVAKTNRELVRAQLAASELKDADAMADTCLKSHYEQCGLAFYAAR
jgi:TPR repeat protein